MQVTALLERPCSIPRYLILGSSAACRLQANPMRNKAMKVLYVRQLVSMVAKQSFVTGVIRLWRFKVRQCLPNGNLGISAYNHKHSFHRKLNGLYTFPAYRLFYLLLVFRSLLHLA